MPHDNRRKETTSLRWKNKDLSTSFRGQIGSTGYLKLKSPLGATGAWWDILIWRDVLGRDPQGRPSSTVTHHLNKTKQNTMRRTHTLHWVHLSVFSTLVCFVLFFSNLVWFWCDLLFKPLEHFVVFSLMQSHLLQVALCQGWIQNTQWG